MPKIHFLKEGLDKRGAHLTWSIDSTSDEIDEVFRGIRKQFSTDPPTVNQSVVASDWAEYRYIVVEAERERESKVFPEIGYYLLLNVSPRDYKDAFSERPPTV